MNYQDILARIQAAHIENSKVREEQSKVFYAKLAEIRVDCEKLGHLFDTRFSGMTVSNACVICGEPEHSIHCMVDNKSTQTGGTSSTD